MNLIELNLIVTGALEIFIAFTIFHHAVPSVLVKGRKDALKIWLLGMALAIFGYGNIWLYLTDQGTFNVFAFGHYCAIAYGVMRFLHIYHKGLTRWWGVHNEVAFKGSILK